MTSEKFEPTNELPVDLTSYLQKKERELFPELGESGAYVAYRDGKSGVEGGSHFGPSHHFRRGLITREILTELLNCLKVEKELLG